jgi:FKBP-type peptidyl-prolyl cis-trans isomerase
MFRSVLPLLVFVLVPLGVADDQEGDEKKGPDPLHPRVKMATTLGDIVLELDAEKAPVTVDNFLRYAQDGFYNDTIFHRVIKTFMIQGGGFTTEMDEKKGLRPPIENEWRNGLKNVRGSIAMARRGWNPRMPRSMRDETPHSATSQFFINVVDNERLDKPQMDGAAYCAFGTVVEGMDVVDKIRDAEVVKHPKYPSPQAVTPKEPIVITSVTLLDGLKYEQVAELAKPAVEAAAEARAKREESAAAAAAKQKEQAEARAKTFSAMLEKGEDENGNKLEKTATGLMYVILKEGDGLSPAFVGKELRNVSVTDWLLKNKDALKLPNMDTVEIHYTGWLLDGTQFDSSREKGKPITMPLNRSIKGWAEGVSMMRAGGRRMLIIPGELAYGPSGRPPRIGPNATLVFDVELVSIK